MRGKVISFGKKRLKKAKKDVRELHIIFGRDNNYEVVLENTRVNMVHLSSKKCYCGEWQVSDLPNKYVLCCIDIKIQYWGLA